MKLPIHICTLSLLTLTTYADNHIENMFCCKSCHEICCRVIENVFKVYDNVTYTLLKKNDTRVVYSYVICIFPLHLKKKHTSTDSRCL